MLTFISLCQAWDRHLPVYLFIKEWDCHSVQMTSEDNFYGSVGFFYHVGPGEPTEVIIRFGVKCLYLLAYPRLALFYSFLSSFPYKHFILTLSNKCCLLWLTGRKCKRRRALLIPSQTITGSGSTNWTGCTWFSATRFCHFCLRPPSTQTISEISRACSMTSGLEWPQDF